MTSTMLGELSRLFQAEARKAPTVSSEIHPSGYHEARRLNAIAQDLRERQRHATRGPLPTIIDPLNLGGRLQDAAAGAAPTAPDPTAGLQGALSNMADQIKTQTAIASGAGTQAGNQAQQAGQQAQTASSNLSTVILAAAVGLGLVIILTRK